MLVLSHFFFSDNIQEMNLLFICERDVAYQCTKSINKRRGLKGAIRPRQARYFSIVLTSFSPLQQCRTTVDESTHALIENCIDEKQRHNTRWSIEQIGTHHSNALYFFTPVAVRLSTIKLPYCAHFKYKRSRKRNCNGPIQVILFKITKQVA